MACTIRAFRYESGTARCRKAATGCELSKPPRAANKRRSRMSAKREKYIKDYTMANTIDDLQTYREVVDHFKQAHRKINLLLGNGFSIAYDRGIFSYNALSRFIMDSDDEIIKRVFQVYNTQNFESIMQQLNNMVH